MPVKFQDFWSGLFGAVALVGTLLALYCHYVIVLLF